MISTLCLKRGLLRAVPRLYLALSTLVGPSLFAQIVGGGSSGGGSSNAALFTCSGATTKTLDTNGDISITASGCYQVDSFGAASTDTLDTINCTANVSFTLVPADANHDITIDSASIPIYGAVDQTLDEVGDYAIGMCPVTNQPAIFLFYDVSGVVKAQSGQFSGSGAALTISEQAAPGAPSTAGQHSAYFNSTNGRLYTHKNGGSALPVNYTLTHATDCTSVTVVGTGVALLAGDSCHELDDDTNYVYDGSAWDQIGAGAGSSTLLYSSGLKVDNSGTSTEALVDITVAANTLSVGDTLQIDAWYEKVNTNGNWNPFLAFGSTTADVIGVNVSPTSNQLRIWNQYVLSVNTSNSISLRSIHTQAGGTTITSTNPTPYTIDITATQHLLFSVTCTSASDTCSLMGYTVQRFPATP